MKITARIKALRSYWEGLCKKCGSCCYEKRYVGSSIIVDFSRPCTYLDPVTKNCTVYEKRFSVCKDCRRLTIFHAWFSPCLPPDCGYVQRFRKKFIHSSTR